MKDAGFGGESKEDLLYSMIFLATILTISNFIGMLLSSKHGRRELILKTSIPMGFTLILLAVAMILNIMISGFKCMHHYHLYRYL